MSRFLTRCWLLEGGKPNIWGLGMGQVLPVRSVGGDTAEGRAHEHAAGTARPGRVVHHFIRAAPGAAGRAPAGGRRWIRRPGRRAGAHRGRHAVDPRRSRASTPRLATGDAAGAVARARADRRLRVPPRRGRPGAVRTRRPALRGVAARCIGRERPGCRRTVAGGPAPAAGVDQRPARPCPAPHGPRPRTGGRAVWPRRARSRRERLDDGTRAEGGRR
jgi:hypothetical protein